MSAPVRHVLGLSPADVAEMSPEALPGLLAALAALQSAVAARLAELPGRPADPLPLEIGGLVTVAEAAKRTGMSRRWLYARADRLPFARRIGRAVRFSPLGIERWLAARKSRSSSSI